MTAVKPHKFKDSYLELLQKFPPRPIRNPREYNRAANVLQNLFMREGLDQDQQGYADMLALLIEVYDRKHYDLGPDTRTPLQRLQSLVRESGTTVNDLGRILESQPIASMVLSGKRQLSKAHIRKLARHFKLDAGYFL